MNYKKFRNIFSNKVLFVQTVFIIAIIGGILFFEKLTQKGLFSVDYNPNKEAVLLIDFGVTKRMFKGEAIDNMTVLDALNASVAVGNIKLQYIVDGNNDTVVTEVNDHSISKDKNFYFYVNEKNIDTKDLNKIFVYPGNKITVKLE